MSNWKLNNVQVVSEKDVDCRLTEVVQHALALKYLFTHMVAQDEPITEELIKATLHILTDGIDAQDGDKSSTYSGIYRIVLVTAGFNTFTSADLIASAMKHLISKVTADIKKQRKKKRWIHMR